MFMKKNAVVAAAVATLMVSSSVFAAGFEKATVWSARYNAVGGAATSITSGSQSVYFNPAGLATGANMEVSGNFAPTFSKFKGPIETSTQRESTSQTSPIYGVTANYRVNDKLGIGVGSYVVGGNKANFEDLDFTALGYETVKPSYQADLTVLEHSIGAGYELIDGLRLGVTWRITQVKARLRTAILSSAAGGILTAVDLDNLAATRYNGWRLGVQYAPKDSRWGVGVNWRTTVDFLAKTDSFSGNQEIAASGTNGALTGAGGATVGGSFPQQISIGTHYATNDDKTSRVMLEYTFTEYSRNQALAIAGSATGLAALGSPAITLPNIALGWKNNSNLRVGYECAHPESWTWRAGYVYTSQVTPSDNARATFANPGPAHTIVLGAGKPVMQNLTLDLAGEYSFASASGATSLTGVNGAGVTGDFSSRAFVAYIGATYAM